MPSLLQFEKDKDSEPWLLMMLAFLIDQVQQLCCKVYQQARKHVVTLRRLFG